MNADMLGLLGAGVALGGWIVWFRLMQRVSVPDNRMPFLLAMAIALALGAAALASGPGLIGKIGAGFALVSGGIYLGLRTQSAQPSTTPVPSVGAPIPDFTLPNEAGESFMLSSISGKPYLLKFFRGHW